MGSTNTSIVTPYAEKRGHELSLYPILGLLTPKQCWG